MKGGRSRAESSHVYILAQTSIVFSIFASLGSSQPMLPKGLSVAAWHHCRRSDVGADHASFCDFPERDRCGIWTYSV